MFLSTAMKTNKPLMYDSLAKISQGFEQILQELERIQQFDWFRARGPIKSAELAVRETRAWTVSEILDVLHQQEEVEWMRLGRLRSAREKLLERGAEVRNRPTGEKRRAVPRV